MWDICMKYINAKRSGGSVIKIILGLHQWVAGIVMVMVANNAMKWEEKR
jgi:hypothetical protein